MTAVRRTSFFPSSSAGNPALTAIANALRVGDHLLERLGAPSARSGATNGKLERSGTTLQPHITDAQESTP